MGFAWDSADEGKMAHSFDFGRARYGSFLDLSHVARELSYPNISLAKLTTKVRGCLWVLRRAQHLSWCTWEWAWVLGGLCTSMQGSKACEVPCRDVIATGESTGLAA